MSQISRQKLLDKIRVLEQENMSLRQQTCHITGAKHCQELLNNIPAPIYLKDTSGSYLFINKRYETLAHVTLIEISGKNDFDIFPEPVATLFRSQDQDVILNNCPMEFEETIPLPGGIHTFITIKFPLHDSAGTITAIAGFCTDITERKEIETREKQLITDLHESKERVKFEKIRNRALAQSKLASLGQMAAGVAHEINQPLSFIKIVIESLLIDSSKNQLAVDEITSDCAETLKQIGRISTLIDHLRVFGREPNAEFKEIKITEVISNSLILMQQRIKLNNIKLSLEIAEGLPTILGNSAELEQVIINLLQNSIDALATIESKEIVLSIVADNGLLKISVKDNGEGIDQDVKDSIFEPFFTTKEEGKGTGIGLSIVQNIVHKHQGSIKCYTPEEGSCMEINLPHKKDNQ